MPALNMATRIATAPLPRILPPNGHAVVDFLTAGIFLGSAAWLWKKNRRAAVAALLCGSAELAVNLLTDYDGLRRKPFGLGIHRHLDFGLAAMTALMPEMLRFDNAEKTFFVAQGAFMTATNQVTRFSAGSGRGEKGFRGRRAA